MTKLQQGTTFTTTIYIFLNATDIISPVVPATRKSTISQETPANNYRSYLYLGTLPVSRNKNERFIPISYSLELLSTSPWRYVFPLQGLASKKFHLGHLQTLTKIKFY